MNKITRLIKYLLPFLIIKVQALIFYSSTDLSYNTVPPIQYLELWNLQGDFGNFTGTPISPYHFITIQHAAPQPSFILNGIEYPILSYYEDWASNLRICKIKGKFPQFVHLYEKNDEVGKQTVMFGKGVGVGGEVKLNDELKGWRWGNLGGLMKWGESSIDSVTISSGGDLLRMLFDPKKGLKELCSLTVGDSGGGTFVKDGNEWKLVGVNYAADSAYGFNNVEDDNTDRFYATIFDEKDLYKFDGISWYRIEDHASTGSYSIRLSSRLAWSQRIVEWT